jgi:gluconolactonase
MTLFPDQPVGLEKIEVFANGLDHSEGIAITLDGDIYVGGEAGQIYRIVDDKPVLVANTGGFLLGLAADAAGRIYAIDNFAKAVWRYDPKTAQVTIYAKGPEHHPFNVPNWGAFDAKGNYYLTDSGDWMADSGLIWIVRPGGCADVWTRNCTRFPNGCCLSADGTKLYVAESAPTGAVVEIPIRPDGTAGERRVLVDLGAAVPDGVACTRDGGITIACYRPDVIYHWHPKGSLRVLAADPRGTVIAAPTNVAFTGPGLETLVVPNLGRWHLSRGMFGVAGVPLNYPSTEMLGG